MRLAVRRRSRPATPRPCAPSGAGWRSPSDRRAPEAQPKTSGLAAAMRSASAR
jgi:hypothetical protein